jgi:hypothetical protein
LARVVMLNKWRSREAAKLLLNSYQGIPEWRKCHVRDSVKPISIRAAAIAAVSKRNLILLIVHILFWLAIVTETGRRHN